MNYFWYQGCLNTNIDAFWAVQKYNNCTRAIIARSWVELFSQISTTSGFFNEKD